MLGIRGAFIKKNEPRTARGYLDRIAGPVREGEDCTGCTSFNHFLFRYLSSQEPEVNGQRNVSTANPAIWYEPSNYESGVISLDFSDSDDDSSDDEDEYGYGKYDIGKEVIPPTTFRPTTDIFTILSVISDAYQYHDCNEFREPVTLAPCHAYKRVTYTDPRLSVNIPSRTIFDEEAFVGRLGDYYCDYSSHYDNYQNWDTIDPQPPYVYPLREESDDEEDDEEISSEEKARRLGNFDHQPYLVEALTLHGHEPPEKLIPKHWRSEWICGRYYEPWKVARTGAGHWVPTTDKVYCPVTMV
jgi:hypothetical protein